MKAFVCLALILGACGWADETADRAAIRQTLRLLNVRSERSAQFTSDADGRVQLEAAMGERRRETVSTEPLAGDYWPFWPAYLREPGRVEAASIRFITADVALADGRVHRQPLLLVLKREQSGWKIASVRFLAP